DPGLGRAGSLLRPCVLPRRRRELAVCRLGRTRPRRRAGAAGGAGAARGRRGPVDDPGGDLRGQRCLDRVACGVRLPRRRHARAHRAQAGRVARRGGDGTPLPVRRLALFAEGFQGGPARVAVLLLVRVWLVVQVLAADAAQTGAVGAAEDLVRQRHVALTPELERRQLYLELVAVLLARTELHLTQAEARHTPEGRGSII